jgi:hypothetical protein
LANSTNSLRFNKRVEKTFIGGKCPQKGLNN